MHYTQIGCTDYDSKYCIEICYQVIQNFAMHGRMYEHSTTSSVSSGYLFVCDFSRGTTQASPLKRYLLYFTT